MSRRDWHENPHGIHQRTIHDDSEFFAQRKPVKPAKPQPRATSISDNGFSCSKHSDLVATPAEEPRPQ